MGMHSAYITSLSDLVYPCLCWSIYFIIFIFTLWYGETNSIRNETHITNLNARSQTVWSVEERNQYFNSKARPFDMRAFSVHHTPLPEFLLWDQYSNLGAVLRTHLPANWTSILETDWVIDDQVKS